MECKENEKKDLEENVQKEEPKIFVNGQEIEPNRWYGICYGRDLEKEIGVGYQ